VCVEGGEMTAAPRAQTFRISEQRVLAALALALVTGFASWRVLSDSSVSSGRASTTATTTAQSAVPAVGPLAVDAASLRTHGAALRQPVSGSGRRPASPTS
jgi:hypothetical protein